MKNDILQWKEPKNYKKYKQKMVPLKTKILGDSVAIIVLTSIWMLFWFVSYINPKVETIRFVYMLPIAFVAGILFFLLSKFTSFVYYDNIKFKEKNLFYFSNGIGKRIQYDNILEFSFKKESFNGKDFDFLIISAKEYGAEKIYRIEIDPNISEENIKEAFEKRGVHGRQ